MQRPVFKVPALPPPPMDRTKPAPSDHTSDREQIGTGNVNQVSASTSHQSTNVVIPAILEPKPVAVKRLVAPQPKEKAHQTTHQVPKSVNSVVNQLSEDEMMAKEFGYSTPEEIELHKRVNKHVNGYLKKACGIPGGVKAYTEAEAATVSSSHFSVELAIAECSELAILPVGTTRHVNLPRSV